MLEREPYRLGFGTYSLTGDEGTRVVAAAIEAGYRHVDTARLYGNEAAVGAAIERADVDREDLFVATKVAHFEEPDPTAEYVREAVERSRERLGVETIDLLYHHWPRHRDEIDVVLPVLDDLHAEGVVEHVGVSNYTVADVDRAREILDAPILANQVECHPLLPQDDLVAAMRERGVTVVAYSPVAQGEVFDVPELVEIGEKHDATPAQVSLAWLLDRDGVAAIPRTSSPTHARENLAAREIDLDPGDVERIESIDRRVRLEDPDWMTW
ncbi:aldo/keto reductase [Halobacteriales archaeon QS_1_68_17]|nr:MAG: aldo/keto reductase [Halobacteriales archaeon QS_1_68_17]